MTPNDHFIGRTAPLTSKRCILYIYSTNIAIEYFKHGIYYPFFSCSKCSLFHNSNVFGSCIINILYTGLLKLKKKFRRQKVNNLLFENRAVYEKMWAKTVRPNRSQTIIAACSLHAGYPRLQTQTHNK